MEEHPAATDAGDSELDLSTFPAGHDRSLVEAAVAGVADGLARAGTRSRSIPLAVILVAGVLAGALLGGLVLIAA